MKIRLPRAPLGTLFLARWNMGQYKECYQIFTERFLWFCKKDLQTLDQKQAEIVSAIRRRLMRLGSSTERLDWSYEHLARSFGTDRMFLQEVAKKRLPYRIAFFAICMMSLIGGAKLQPVRNAE